MLETNTKSPSPVIAGPILRRVQSERLVFWLVMRESLSLSLALYANDDGSVSSPDHTINLEKHIRAIAVGERAWIVLVDIDLSAHGVAPLAENVAMGYDFLFGEAQQSLAELEPGLSYPGEARPRFTVRKQLDHVLHGSCRRPHCDTGDGMARADCWLSERRDDVAQWPTVMLFTGDQIYADDVAGPLLRAVHGLIEQLGLWPEKIEGALVEDSADLFASEYSYYRRDELLPQEKSTRDLRDRFFGGTEKPVFTSATSGNHLITLAEVIAMYFLCWSDEPWRGLSISRPELDDENDARYDQEQSIIDAFVKELPGVRRLMANVPTAMIFDDHDITDDWNLTRLWVDSAYGNPFSRRIIGNAMIAYLLCQGWGNQPEAFNEVILPAVETYTAQQDAASQDTLIDALLDFHDWGFTLETNPAVVVLDTRTRRWHREHLPGRPSGLMDWEALIAMQAKFIDRDSVVIVSAAPIFGVKLIENIQRIFTWFGKPLMVDAENWMGHKGAARTLLNIFHHRGTPENFTVLSGDVHYSFVYDVTLRRISSRQRIWQITSSGVKNIFPRTLLDWFDRLNRWLYAPYSPLNWLTKRRRLRVAPRSPQPSSHGERLVNGSGMGYLRFDEQGMPYDIWELGADGQDVSFKRGGKDSN